LPIGGFIANFSSHLIIGIRPLTNFFQSSKASQANIVIIQAAFSNAGG
jgi:hypothetical protein